MANNQANAAAQAAAALTVNLSGTAQMKEGERAVYTVSLNRPADTPVTVEIKMTGNSLSKGDARLHVDRVVIPAGETSATFKVSAYKDGQQDNGESFRVEISNVSAGASQSENTAKQTLLPVTYSYPEEGGSGSEYWNAVHKAGSGTIPYVLVNPHSGPGTALEANYAQLLQTNTDAGFKNIAYVPTGYKSNNADDVKKLIKQYIDLYKEDKIHGFFLDEFESDNPQSAAYLAEIYNYVKNTYGQEMTVIANPGKHIPDAVSPYADIFVTFEGAQDRYTGNAPNDNYTDPTSAFEKDPANAHRIWHIVHTASADKYEEVVNLSKARGAGWVAVSDDVGDNNRFDELPSDFTNLLGLVGSGNNTGGDNSIRIGNAHIDTVIADADAAAVTTVDTVVKNVTAPVAEETATASAPAHPLPDALKNVSAQNQSVLPVSYSYPLDSPDTFSEYWQTIHAAGKDKIPYVLINPNSGPYTEKPADQQNYVTLVNKNTELGFQNIAYVRTDYNRVKLSDVKEHIDAYGKLYGKDKIHGFFFDEFESAAGDAAAYLKNIYDYVKTQYGSDALVIANPGKHIPDSVSPYADIFVTSETTASEYISEYQAPTSAFEQDPANAARIWHMAHSATPEQYSEVVELSQQRGAGWVFVTDDVGTPDGKQDPYDAMPGNFAGFIDQVHNGDNPAAPVSDGLNAMLPDIGTTTFASTQGADTFVFTGKAVFDRPVELDFNTAEGDKIALDQVLFDLTADNWFAAEGETLTADTRIFQQDGGLFFDADGSEPQYAAEKFAAVDTVLKDTDLTVHTNSVL
ncbi:spherulation-specific family 4 protein [Neisseria sp.]|uniref:spherulation-specific family 4 protein n=1 Tax=Neisseria sp. TaxID=192066 RepID=UPI0035A190EA